MREKYTSLLIKDNLIELSTCAGLLDVIKTKTSIINIFRRFCTIGVECQSKWSNTAHNCSLY